MRQRGWRSRPRPNDPGIAVRLPLAQNSGAWKIPVIEDDDSLRGVLELGQADQGSEVLKAGSGREGVRIALEEPPHPILLDVGLPGQNRLDACRELRQNGLLAPIIMVAGRVEEINRVLSLEIGAGFDPVPVASAFSAWPL